MKSLLSPESGPFSKNQQAVGKVGTTGLFNRPTETILGKTTRTVPESLTLPRKFENIILAQYEFAGILTPPALEIIGRKNNNEEFDEDKLTISAPALFAPYNESSRPVALLRGNSANYKPEDLQSSVVLNKVIERANSANTSSNSRNNNNNSSQPKASSRLMDIVQDKKKNGKIYITLHLMLILMIMIIMLLC